jgi:predicted nucleic acid-binding protein
MIHGIDTSFLVAMEILGHGQHSASRARFLSLARKGDQFALAPQVLAEFIHVVTDSRRFSNPLAFDTARERVEAWWNAEEVISVFPTDESTTRFLSWLLLHQLGRKRLLDTLLAATLEGAGVTSLLTLNRKDFEVFGCFDFPS